MPITDFDWIYGLVKLAIFGPLAFYVLGPLLGKLLLMASKKNND